MTKILNNQTLNFAHSIYFLLKKIMAAGPITSWEIDGETVETVSDFILGGSKITAVKTLTPWKKSMTNLDSMLKSRDITLPTRV